MADLVFQNAERGPVFSPGRVSQQSLIRSALLDQVPAPPRSAARAARLLPTLHCPISWSDLSGQHRRDHQSLALHAAVCSAGGSVGAVDRGVETALMYLCCCLGEAPPADGEPTDLETGSQELSAPAPDLRILAESPPTLYYFKVINCSAVPLAKFRDRRESEKINETTFTYRNF